MYIAVCRIHFTWVSRRHTRTPPSPRRHSPEFVRAAAAARTLPLPSTCCERSAYRPTSRCSVPLCRRCVPGAWPGAGLRVTGRRCTTTSAWVPIFLLLVRGRRSTRCVLRARLIHTQLNVLPSCTATQPVSELLLYLLTDSSLKESFENVDATAINDFIKEVIFYHLIIALLLLI